MNDVWSTRELEQLATRDELRIAPRRDDGTLAKPRIVWAVRVDDAVYIRSVNGTDGAWYRSTRARHEGHVSVAAIERDVAFLDIDPADAIGDRIDAAYHAKYASYPGPVARITAARARATTLRIVPR